ncbi:MAG: S41 family peptidase [bacterium]
MKQHFYRTKKSRTNTKAKTSLSVIAASAMAGSAMTIVLLSTGFTRPSVTPDTYRQLDLFGEVFEQVQENYVTIPENKELIKGAIDGMLTSLDPHSSYLAPEDFDTMQEQTRGSFAGLGIQVTMDNDGPGRGLVRVVSPIFDTPADRAGIQTNDYIYEIDGKSVFGMTLNEAISLMKGPRGTSVELKILRKNADEPIEVTIVRDIVTVSPVISRVEGDDFGYVRLTSFTEQTNKKMREAIKELDQEIPGGMKGLILDLRGNPGGLLDQAVAVSDAFLQGGEIVSTRGRHAKDTMRELGTPGDLMDGRPILVLVSTGSASASEIVAGALQDRNRALLLGTKTFGKGSVQTVLPLQNGINGALRLTTARYYTPSGRSIQALGIVPDILMPVTREGQDQPIERRREADLEGALSAEEPEDGTETQEHLRDRAAEITGNDAKLTPEEEAQKAKDEAQAVLVEPVTCPADEDCQLNRAIEVLRDNANYSRLLADAGTITRH